MRSFLLADNALGFVPFMLPAAGFLFWARTRIAARPAKRDVLLDVFFAGPAIVFAVFILFLTPARLSWYFWLHRLDLLAMAFIVLASGCVFLGYQQVLRACQAFALMFLMWPYPVVRLQEAVVVPMTAVTVAVGRAATTFLDLPYSVDAGAGAFSSTHLADPENFTITLSAVCSGGAVTMGFLLVGTVLCCVMRGPLSQRLRWLGVGVVVAHLSNLVRVIALLVVSANVSFRFGFEVLHPILGLVLFALVVLLMLVLLRPFGLALTLGEGGSHRSWEPVEGGGMALTFVYGGTLLLAVLTSVFVAQAQDSFLGAARALRPSMSPRSARSSLRSMAGNWRTCSRSAGQISSVRHRGVTSSSTPTQAAPPWWPRSWSPTSRARWTATRSSSASSSIARRSSPSGT
jgi:exosortase/archaeosortase family protein